MNTEQYFRFPESWDFFQTLRLNAIDSCETEFDGRYPELGDGWLSENETIDCDYK